MDAAQRALHPIAYRDAGPLDESGVAQPVEATVTASCNR